MDSLLTQTSVAIREVQNDLLTYENAQDHSSESACVASLTKKFQTLLETCDRLDILVNKESAQRRAQSRQRVNEIKYDINHYQTAFGNITRKKQERDERERQQDLLLQRKFTPINSESNGDTHINLDHSLQYSQQLDSVHARMDNIIDQTRATLSNLRVQGLNLKNVQKKMISLGNMLGLSSTVIHSIERRTASDWWFLFGGMVVTLIIMFILYKWLV